MRRGALAGPIIIIAIGVLFLLNNIGLAFPIREVLRNGWPFLLIVIGALQLAGTFAGRGSLPSGLILITIGTLFAFERLVGLRFRDTWPVILIAVGVIGLLRAGPGGASWGSRRFGGGLR